MRTKPPPSSLPLFVGAITLEGVYLLGRTLLLARFTDPVTRELVWTLWRLPFCVAYWLIAGRAARSLVPMEKLHPLVLIAVPVAALGDPLAGVNVGGGLANHLVMAATSPVVGLREELFYRVILMGSLERWLGPSLALLASSAVFVAFHIGAQPMDAISIAMLASGGLVLGAIYQRTRNLWLVVAIHTAWDAITAAWPAIRIVDFAIGFYMHLFAIILIMSWYWFGPSRVPNGE